MAAGWMEPNQCRSLLILVESVTAPLLIEHPAPVCLESDVESDLEVPGDAAQTAELIRSLTQQALDSMPDGGDLTVTACRVGDRMELEIADNGGSVFQRERKLPIVAAALNVRLQWQDCPQGGGAVTVSFPADTIEKRAAA
ncbi:MAG: ATPase [Planctomycetota bacterium]